MEHFISFFLFIPAVLLLNIQIRIIHILNVIVIKVNLIVLKNLMTFLTLRLYLLIIQILLRLHICYLLIEWSICYILECSELYLSLLLLLLLVGLIVGIILWNDVWILNLCWSKTIVFFYFRLKLLWIWPQRKLI